MLNSRPTEIKHVGAVYYQILRTSFFVIISLTPHKNICNLLSTSNAGTACRAWCIKHRYMCKIVYVLRLYSTVLRYIFYILQYSLLPAHSSAVCHVHPPRQTSFKQTPSTPQLFLALASQATVRNPAPSFLGDASPSLYRPSACHQCAGLLPRLPSL